MNVRRAPPLHSPKGSPCKASRQAGQTPVGPPQASGRTRCARTAPSLRLRAFVGASTARLEGLAGRALRRGRSIQKAPGIRGEGGHAERRRARRNGSAAKIVRGTAPGRPTNGRPPPPRLRRGHRSFMRRWQAGTGAVRARDHRVRGRARVRGVLVMAGGRSTAVTRQSLRASRSGEAAGSAEPLLFSARLHARGRVAGGGGIESAGSASTTRDK